MVQLFTKERFYKGLDSLKALSIYLDTEKRSTNIDLIIQMQGLEPYFADNTYFENVKKLYTDIKTTDGLYLIREIAASHNNSLNILFERNGYIGEFLCQKVIWFKNHLCAIDIMTVDDISKRLFKEDVLATTFRNEDYKLELHSYLPLFYFQRILITDVISVTRFGNSIIPYDNYYQALQKKEQQEIQQSSDEIISIKGIDDNLHVTLDYSHKSIIYMANISDTKIIINREGLEEEHGYLYIYNCYKHYCNLDDLLYSIEKIKQQFTTLNEIKLGFVSYFDLCKTKGMKIYDLQEKLAITFNVSRKYVSY